MIHARRASWFTWVIPFILAISAAAPARAWDEEGHRIVTRLACEALPPSMPDWLRTPEVRARLDYLASEPDRWRGQHHPVLDHANNPEHYIDEELLRPYGLSIKTLPRFRREYTDMLAAQRALHPDKFDPYNRSRDNAYTRLSPGLLPYRIAELQWKIAANWTQLKTYEANRKYATDEMIRNARENIVYLMGVLSHYVADAAQPLHITIHHHGWEGPNPKGYTRSHGFHEMVDGRMLRHHRITARSLAGRARPPRKVTPQAYWPQILAYVYESYDQVEPLYELEKSGDLRKERGKVFIENRLLEGGAMLAGLWRASFDAAHIDDFRAARLTHQGPGGE